MGLDCGAKCMKWLLFIFNFLIFLSGGLLLAIGIWIFADKQFPAYVANIFPAGSETLIQVAAITLTTVGGLTFLIGFLGCCGACKESTCMLATFATLLMVLLIAQVAAAILAWVFRKELNTELGAEMKKQVPQVGPPDAKDELSKAWNLMQTRLQCCGADNYMDYRKSTHFNQSGVPLTCCALETMDSEKPIAKDSTNCFAQAKQDGLLPTTPYTLHVEGCYKKMVDWFKAKSAILIGLGIGIAIIEILGVIFACCVRQKINEGGDKYA